MIYEAIGGSRAYGLNMDQSDVDILRVGQEKRIYMEDGCNVIQIPAEEFLRRARLGAHWYDAQWLFPEQFRVDNALSGYILENREAMVQAVRPAVYRVMTEHAAALCTHCSWLYPLFPKRLAYALLHYQILANHAGGMDFSQAMRPDGEELDTLLTIRRGEMELAEVLERVAAARTAAENCAAFYQQQGSDEPLRGLDALVQEMTELEAAEGGAEV